MPPLVNQTPEAPRVRVMVSLIDPRQIDQVQLAIEDELSRYSTFEFVECVPFVDLGEETPHYQIMVEARCKLGESHLITDAIRLIDGVFRLRPLLELPGPVKP